jgi:hypothetical protein
MNSKDLPIQPEDVHLSVIAYGTLATIVDVADERRVRGLSSNKHEITEAGIQSEFCVSATRYDTAQRVVYNGFESFLSNKIEFGGTGSECRRHEKEEVQPYKPPLKDPLVSSGELLTVRSVVLLQTRVLFRDLLEASR